MPLVSTRGLLVLFILISISVWVWLILRPASIDTFENDKTLLQNNFFLEEFSVHSYNAEGDLVTQTNGKQFIQSAEDADGVLFEPRFVFFQEANPNWEVTAQRAYVKPDFASASLRDDVLLRQLSSETASLSTTILDIDLTNEIANTSADVKIEFDNNEMTSTGMNANLKNSQIDLSSNVRSTYVLP